MEMEQGLGAQPMTIPLGLRWFGPDVMRERKPGHLVLVLQGYRQWSQNKDLSLTDIVGAAAGRLLELVDYCALRSIDKLSLHVFQDDFSAVPRGGNAEFMNTVVRYIAAAVQNMHRNEVHMRVEGAAGLSSLTRGLLDHMARCTYGNIGMELVVVVDGATAAARTGGEPDFVIRTGGPLPVQQSMLWDTRKTALYFSGLPWPDFDVWALREALGWYGEPHRGVGIESHAPLRSVAANVYTKPESDLERQS